ncbi:Hypp680 [Branchiostoma lanceolatum]|uniref:Hypp680 protein n=1 Tax=Branchiostoma lanceolatum TaxID=7740 RepID=A0A8J9W1D5_BRALA|nr:Hypp680 [Branchiostoma lanceolatum]
MSLVVDLTACFLSGLSSYYMEACSPIMAVVPTGGKHTNPADMEKMLRSGMVYEQDIACHPTTVSLVPPPWP